MGRERGVGATELELARLALDLGAAEAGGPLGHAEQVLLERAATLGPSTADDVASARHGIESGGDPLGERLLAIRSPQARRRVGAFYTPSAIVRPMLDWVLAQRPSRIVDAGCGSGRFAAEAVRRDPRIAVIAVDMDPLATLITRAVLASLRAGNGRVLCADYLTIDLAFDEGRIAFVGNPPYVRHHDLSAQTKRWAAHAAKRLGREISSLAGLHALFFLATALHARPGDVGCFVTSAEWLDVGYGRFLRDLLIDGMGIRALNLIDPQAVPFENVMTTALITCFEVGREPSEVRLRLVSTAHELEQLEAGASVAGQQLSDVRWSRLIRAMDAETHDGLMPLSQVAQVHRGVVTGANDFFLLSAANARALGLESYCRPAITSAREIINAGGVIRENGDRRLLLDLPGDLDRSAHPKVDAYLKRGEVAGPNGDVIAQRYICRHRRPWWRVGPPLPAPIVASYMARQAPVFALNPDHLALVNIGHGIYPRATLSPTELETLVDDLNSRRERHRGSGRMYHGGLEKFEPREMEALLVPVRP